MDSRKIVLLVGALLVAGITAFFARSLIAGASAPQAVAMGAPAPVAVTGPDVLVATRALPVGTILDATALKFQPWPQQLIDNAYYLKAGTDVAKLTGTVVRNAITAGQPITRGALVSPGDRGFLAAALGPGMRAVTVSVSSQAAVAGFVFPGDRIDLVLTQTVNGGGDGQPLKVSETIMRNVRVLATDQRTDNVVGEDGKSKVTSYSTVTLEATPKMAEQVAVARTIGELSLSLRALADNSSELEEAIASGAVKVPDGDPRAEKAMMLRLATQPQTGGTTFATGADVSRFQRSTVPARAPTAGAPVGNGPAPGGAVGAGGATIQGPAVRVARGNSVTVVPVGGKN
ncbi:Flp pilus assembly protein CpaB [Sphingomonas sp. CD22]|jgi:pilus assembly protein CpaB|uniref:Flp pilus assembly protein CpaB n=1 Tax=Sphingomonas sp. CD22 TaxID=3100214 RepID=UPI002ADF6D74|nr:Flp pilus assembly protein CpaB [Sphingomonas sp. CD22]MEA1082871.1 Flp pilus assembly protein CpaB [Sphingomonas sp. CD22]